ncbi:MAG: DUF4365 domain-containing protein [Planctomycetia bacterium]|nr:DUF4365 domain-containing protein [Planctomycetia bacterium]
MERNYVLIRSEMSHAFLQTVIAYLGCEYQRSNPPADGFGIDATGCFRGIWSDEEPSRHDIDIKFQLKSTSHNFTEKEDVLGYSLDRAHYEKYHENAQGPHNHLLLLMLLPEEGEYASWLELTPEQLVVKKCMYWTSLRNAPALAEDRSSITVYFPKKNLFSPEGLKKDILKPLAEGKELSCEF